MGAKSKNTNNQPPFTVSSFLLNLISEFAGPLVDLLITSMAWNQEARQRKKQLLQTLTVTIDCLAAKKCDIKMRQQVTKLWDDLAVDLEEYASLSKA